MNERVGLLVSEYPQLHQCAQDVEIAIDAIVDCYKNGGKLLLCGNGGSAADSAHIVGELMKGFMKRRPVPQKLADKMKTKNPAIDDELLCNLQCGLPAIDLCESISLLSAYCNDVDPDYIYAQQVFGLGKKGDVFLGMSTSGNAKNVNLAAKVARSMGLTVIGMTGMRESDLSRNAHTCIQVPETVTYKIQELHLPVYHAICDAVEHAFFPDDADPDASFFGGSVYPF